MKNRYVCLAVTSAWALLTCASVSGELWGMRTSNSTITLPSLKYRKSNENKMHGNNTRLKCSCIFFKVFVATGTPILEWILPYMSFLAEANVMNIPQHPSLVLHVLTSWQLAAEPVTSPHASAEVCQRFKYYWRQMIMCPGEVFFIVFCRDKLDDNQVIYLMAIITIWNIVIPSSCKLAATCNKNIDQYQRVHFAWYV